MVSSSFFFLRVVLHELAVESGHPVQDAVELVFRRQEGGAEVPRAGGLAEARAGHHHHPGGVHQLEAVQLVRGYRVGLHGVGFGDELGRQIHLTGMCEQERRPEARIAKNNAR